MWWFLLVDLVLIGAVLLVWQPWASDAEDNSANPGLRGSKPPAGQLVPELGSVAGVEPAGGDPDADAFPTRAELAGSPVLLVATCIECRSGDIIGGFLGRMGAGELPDDTRVLVVGWEGDMAAWARELGIRFGAAGGARVDGYAATTPQATATLRRTFGIGPVRGAEESGVAYAYDTRGRWRSTFFIGQLDRDDIRHDLEVLARD